MEGREGGRGRRKRKRRKEGGRVRGKEAHGIACPQWKLYIEVQSFQEQLCYLWQY